MTLLDTNIVSQLLRKRPEPKVKTRLAAQDGAEVYLTDMPPDVLDRAEALFRELAERFDGAKP